MNDSQDWKDILACAATFLALCIGLSTCQYVEHRISIEKPTQVTK